MTTRSFHRPSLQPHVHGMPGWGVLLLVLGLNLSTHGADDEQLKAEVLTGCHGLVDHLGEVLPTKNRCLTVLLHVHGEARINGRFGSATGCYSVARRKHPLGILSVVERRPGLPGSVE